jgi:GTPase SAR1 family protein
MVKLLFKPGPENGAVSSITSKRETPGPRPEQNLSPFNGVILPEITVDKKVIMSTKDIVGLENCCYVLNDWYQNGNEKVLIIVGPTGCGKTTLVQSYCEENEIQLYVLKSSETIKSKRELLRDIFLFAQYDSSNFFVKRTCTQKKLILIDEYQNGQSDILGISDIQNLNLLRTPESRAANKKELKLFLHDLDCPYTMPPILLISADNRGSKLSELKKLSIVYYINEIPFNTIFTWVSSSFPHLSKDLTTEIVKLCQSDKRLILNNINFTGLNKTNFTFFKDTETSNFDFLNGIFENKQPDFNEIFKVYETDGFMISNLVHENYLEYSENIHKAADSAESISLGETFFSNTYESSKSFIPEVHCLHSICMPSYYSRSDRVNKNPRTSCINNRYNIYLNNMKIMDRINHHDNSLTILDVLYIKKFLNQGLVKSKQLNEHQEIFLKGLLTTLKTPEKLELIYKHFSDFSSKEIKTKNFTIKFKDKLKYITNSG